MANFINSIDELGDEVVFASIVDKTIVEFRDNVLNTINDYAFIGCGSLQKLLLPNCERISAYMCQNCTSLREVDFSKAAVGPGGTGNIFRDCTSLEKASFPLLDGLASNAFYGCTNLKRLEVPSVIDVYDQSLYGCKKLLELVLPKADFVQRAAFTQTTSLCCLVLGHSAVVSMSGSLLATALCNQLGYIYVPATLLDSYKSATNWSAHADRFRCMEDYTCLGRWDDYYEAKGYETIYPKSLFVTATEDSVNYSTRLDSVVEFIVGETYLVMYDYNEYGVVATEEGLVCRADDGTLVFQIGHSLDGYPNVLQTRAELFASAIAIYKAT